MKNEYNLKKIDRKIHKWVFTVDKVIAQEICQ